MYSPLCKVTFLQFFLLHLIVNQLSSSSLVAKSFVKITNIYFIDAATGVAWQQTKLRLALHGWPILSSIDYYRFTHLLSLSPFQNTPIVIDSRFFQENRFFSLFLNFYLGNLNLHTNIMTPSCPGTGLKLSVVHINVLQG